METAVAVGVGVGDGVMVGVGVVVGVRLGTAVNVGVMDGVVVAGGVLTMATGVAPGADALLHAAITKSSKIVNKMIGLVAQKCLPMRGFYRFWKITGGRVLKTH